MSGPSDTRGMDPQLMLLLELQDLRAQRKELAESEVAERMQEEHFHIDPADARSHLDEKITEIEQELHPRIRARYAQIVPMRDRVVVPVINGVCYGCFVSIPTATAGDRDSPAGVQSCEHCGCFIYILN